MEYLLLEVGLNLVGFGGTLYKYYLFVQTVGENVKYTNIQIYKT